MKKLYGKILDGRKFLKTHSYMFPQTWPNTSIGMDLYNGCSGQAFTEAYTTAFQLRWCDRNEDGRWHDSQDEIYAVFFGDNLAYSFINPNDKFFLDFKSHNMTSQREALEKYI